MSNSFSHVKHARPKQSYASVATVDSEVASKTGSKKVVLQVIDAPFNGARPRPLAEFYSDDDIAEGVRRLPPHETKTARILEVTVHSDFIVSGLRETKGPQITKSARDNLISFLQDTYAQQFQERRIFRWLSDPLIVNDIGSISSQWSQRLGGGRSNLSRLVNRTSLQQHPLDFDVHPRDSYLTCAQDGHDRLIVIIVNDIWSDQLYRTNRTKKSPETIIPFTNPRCTSIILSGNSWTGFADDTLDTFAQLLVLDFFMSSIYLRHVDYYERLIYPRVDEALIQFSAAKNPHLQVPLGLFEPRMSIKSKEAFKEIADAEGILRSVNNLVDSINFVVDALDRNNVAGSHQPRRRYYEQRMQELKGVCKERQKNVQGALEALNRQLDYLTKGHAIREAKAIKILTILAALYLPMSLAAALLSMSAPFRTVAHTVTGDKSEDEMKKGTNLLFDFFGVFIGLATITMFIVHAIRLVMWVRSRGLSVLSYNFSGRFSIFNYGSQWRYGGQWGRVLDFILGMLKWWLGAGFFITLSVIFFVGMRGDAQGAWDTARWLFAAYITGGGLFVIAGAAIYWSLDRKRVRV